MKTVTKSGRSTPFLYQYLLTTAEVFIYCDDETSNVNTYQCAKPAHYMTLHHTLWNTICYHQQSTNVKQAHNMTLHHTLWNTSCYHQQSTNVDLHYTQPPSQQPRFSWPCNNTALIWLYDVHFLVCIVIIRPPDVCWRYSVLLFSYFDHGLSLISQTAQWNPIKSAKFDFDCRSSHLWVTRVKMEQNIPSELQSLAYVVPKFGEVRSTKLWELCATKLHREKWLAKICWLIHCTFLKSFLIIKKSLWMSPLILQ